MYQQQRTMPHCATPGTVKWHGGGDDRAGVTLAAGSERLTHRHSRAYPLATQGTGAVSGLLHE
jgi:hypothetical protein